MKSKIVKPPQRRAIDSKPATVFEAKPTTGRVDAGAAYDARISTSPRRLGPGRSGVLSVVVTFRGNTVVLPGTRIEMRFDRGAIPVAFGSFVVDEAKPGTLATIYRGQDVFEDSMVFRVPITIAAGAKHGKYTVTGEVMVEGRNGKTGAPLGLLSRVIEGLVVVGKPLPVHRASSRRTAPGGAAQRGGVASPLVAGGERSPRDVVRYAGSQEGRMEGAPPNAAPGPATVESDGVWPWPYFAALGVFGSLCFLWIRRCRS